METPKLPKTILSKRARTIVEMALEKPLIMADSSLSLEENVTVLNNFNKDDTETSAYNEASPYADKNLFPDNLHDVEELLPTTLLHDIAAAEPMPMDRQPSSQVIQTGTITFENKVLAELTNVVKGRSNQWRPKSFTTACKMIISRQHYFRILLQLSQW